MSFHLLCRRVRAVLSTVIVLTAACSLGPAPVHAQGAGLRPLADGAGLHLAAAADVEALGDDAYLTLLRDNVNMLSTRAELSMAVVQPRQGVFDFTTADAVVDVAVANSMTVRGHDLIGADSVPDWVTNGVWTADTLATVLREQVTAVVAHLRERNPGIVIQYDVVADAFLPDGSARPSIWEQVIGPDYIRIAFDAARTADPDAQLFYDDFYDDLSVTRDAVASGVPIVGGATTEHTTCDQVPKCVGVRDALTALINAGAPIDGVGFQAHIFSPDPADFTRFSTWAGDLGLRWAITEFDVPLPVTEIGVPDSVAFQASVYADALTACLDADGCDTFVSWGITDRLSPIPAETGGAFGGASWFDENDQPKAARDAMAQVLTERQPVVTTTAAPTTVAATSPPTTVAATGGGSDSGVLAVVVGAIALGLVGVVIALARRRKKNP